MNQEAQTAAPPISRQAKKEQLMQEITSKPGQLAWVDKNQLTVDGDYQRNTHRRHKKIAKDFCWVYFGVLMVAHRESDGRYYVFDGQNRLGGAMLRPEIENVPCIIYETSGSKEEAEGFVKINEDRLKVKSLELWKANLLRGDPLTTTADILIRNMGRTVTGSAGPTSVSCISTILRALRINPERTIRVWPLIGGVCSEKVFHENIFAGLLWIEANLPSGQSLIDKRWADRVMRIGYDKLLDGSKRSAAFYRGGSPNVWARGMIDELNRGCRIRMKVNGYEAPGQETAEA